jgi:hypothetical protein
MSIGIEVTNVVTAVIFMGALLRIGKALIVSRVLAPYQRVMDSACLAICRIGS